MGNRIKTVYPGVFFKEVRRIGGKGTEKSYYIIFKQNGKNIEEHCGYQYRDAMTPSKAAKIRGQRIENRRQSKKQIRIESEWTFSRLWDKYSDHRKRETGGKGPNHADISRYTFYIKDSIGDIAPGNLKPLHLEPIHDKLSTKAAGTRYCVLQLVNRISTWGKRQQLCTAIPFHIELPTVDIEKTEMLTDKQFSTLLAILRHDGTEVATLMELALSTGMRRGEMLKLLWQDVDLENGFIKIVNPKGKKTTTIPMNDAAKNVFESLDQQTEYVFQGLRERSENWIVLRGKLLIAKAGLPDDFRPFHGLRHAFASMLASKGVPLFSVSQLLTHKNLAMTQRYSHLTDQALKDASNVANSAFGGAEKHRT